MVYYNFKLIIFSIILGILTLIYNNDSNGLYKNINNKYIILVPMKFRSLAVLSHEHSTNHIYECNQLTECGFTNEKKYQKNNYPTDNAKTKQKIPEIRKKENTATSNLKKYNNVTYDKHKDTIANRTSRSIKYLEMQRKLYNNFYIKPEMYFQNLPDKSNDKYCEYSNKKKSSNKVNDKYLDNLKTSCFGAADVCGISTAFVVKCGIGAVKSLQTVKTALAGTSGVKLTGINAFNAVIKSFTNSTVVATFQPYAIAIYVILAIIVVLIILYIWLYRRRKNSWKHECKKHICT
ncbi:stevor PIR protein,putative [Plasmodium sp. gorilla clade G3]|nr:stevor PIR protein,putative [Plasmodium sp. gorilla clade G3]